MACSSPGGCAGRFALRTELRAMTTADPAPDMHAVNDASVEEWSHTPDADRWELVDDGMVTLAPNGVIKGSFAYRIWRPRQRTWLTRIAALARQVLSLL